MERNPLHDLTKGALIALILELREQMAELVCRNHELVKQIDEQARRIEELEQRNPTPR